VAPLEFQGFITWRTHGYTEAIVMVSAQDVGRKPELVLGKRFRYMPSASGTSTLMRHVYLTGNTHFQHDERSFAVHDNFRPYCEVALGRRAIQSGASAVVGVLLVDPESGAIEYHDRDHIPDWVARVIPESIAEANATWWGLYGKGWLNSWTAMDGV